MSLNEAVSSIIYHFTDHVNALSIIKNGEFRLSPAFRNDVEEQYAKNLYFLSTTRSRQGSYHQGNSAGVMFVIDGRKVNSKYRGGPVDYWQRGHGGGDEMEDRVHHNQPTMPINGIISGIDVLINTQDTTNPHVETLMRITYLLYLYAKKNSITFNAYRHRSGFLTNNPKDRHSHGMLLSMKDGKLPDTSYTDKRDSKIGLTPEKHDMYNFIEIYYRPYEKLNDNAKDLHRRMAQNGVDVFSTLRADITNHSRGNASKFQRKLIDSIGAIMKKEGATTFKEFFDKIHERVSKEAIDQNKKYRHEILMRGYEKDKDLYDHMISVLEKGEPFDRSLFSENEEMMHLQVGRIGTAIYDLDMISEATKERWYQYGGLSDTALEFVFGIKFDY